MSLLHFLKTQSAHFGFALRACHFDHMTRPGSARDAAFVSRQCQAWDIPWTPPGRTLPAWAAEHHMGQEEAGRTLRYRWFDTLADQYDPCVIATRPPGRRQWGNPVAPPGPGLRSGGLGGASRPGRDGWVRPFLTVPRQLMRTTPGEQQVPLCGGRHQRRPGLHPGTCCGTR